MATKPTVVELKALGNAAVNATKYGESILHYTRAIKLDPKNYILYSNRSFAFLKMQQFYLALEDANETIRLNPEWPKGYFRKGEVEFATYRFLDAYKSYEKALELQPGDEAILQAMSKANKERVKDMRGTGTVDQSENDTPDDQIPWVGAGIGIVLGAVILIADYLYAAKPTNPLLMTISTILIALFGYVIARVFRYFVKCQRDGLLAQRETVFDEDTDESEDVPEKNGSSTGSTTRYSKSQARQRYKRGKLQ